MKLLKIAIPLLVACSPAMAEQIQFKVVDIFWLQHSSKGGGVEFVYQFDSKPNDGLEALETFALSECNRLAPKYVPLVLEKVGKSDADFVAINFRFGGAFGIYAKFFAKYTNGICSEIE